MSPLTSIILCPLIAALVLCFVPRNYRFVMRIVAMVATFVTMILAIKMFWQYDNAVIGESGTYKFEQLIPWVKSLGLNYHVGVDGINVGLILMGAIVAFAAACVSWDINSRDKEFYILLLVMTGGILGAFASLDIFMFYFFHELALVPTFIMIGVWGRGENKNYATFQITLYLSIGALISLVGLIALYVKSGANTFDIVALTTYVKDHPISLHDQNFIFPLLLFGFGILISLWPFHTWAPLGYGSAPTATAMLHAGVLKKFGLYGLIRIALPLLPQATHSWINVIAWLCLGNIFYCGLVAMRQKNFNWLIGYSSVAHMGFVFLGIASLNLIGITGAVLVMIAHGFLAALSFGLSGYLYHITGTLEMDKMGGLLRKLPFLGTALMMALFAGCGLPGFANFAGEVTIFFGAYKTYPLITGIAVWGASVIGAVYMLRAIRNMLHGVVPEKFMGVAESAFPHRKVPYLILLVSLLVFGFFPRLLTEKIEPSAKRIVDMAGGEVAKVALVEAAPIETKKH
ncbi:complex I subunit 4 family protein [Pedosphaera parvula]|uniref:Proton-translocating NADH-quinone oxidoreductase, chain M n=1 Tax=Pedosphaera parvula (strain Ellin514) TaxID=320771 RepID=B9XHI7_PEDPL|nr:NADH-quinone oxidoreductase subunit M [Pedosphaera parvula]EEF60822.1 proton-translocating NADH-quinone oxidoreductase, chain M [Pedosphaera parvula Ellin514]